MEKIFKRKKLKVKIFENDDYEFDNDNLNKIMLYEAMLKKYEYVINGLTGKIDNLKIKEEAYISKINELKINSLELENLKNKLYNEEQININLNRYQEENEKRMEIMEKKMDLFQNIEKERNYYKEKYEETIKNTEKELTLI